MVGGQPYLLSYNGGTRQVKFSAFLVFPGGLQTVWQGQWGHWTHFVPVNGYSADFLLTYDAVSGMLMTSRYGGGMHGVGTAWSGTVEKGWTHVQTAKFNGNDVALFYNSQTGTSAYRIIDAQLVCGQPQTLFDPMAGRASFDAVALDGPINVAAWCPQTGTLELYRRWGADDTASGSHPRALAGRRINVPGHPLDAGDLAIGGSVFVNGSHLSFCYLRTSGEIRFFKLRPF